MGFCRDLRMRFPAPGFSRAIHDPRRSHPHRPCTFSRFIGSWRRCVCPAKKQNRDYKEMPRAVATLVPHPQQVHGVAPPISRAFAPPTRMPGIALTGTRSSSRIRIVPPAPLSVRPPRQQQPASPPIAPTNIEQHIGTSRETNPNTQSQRYMTPADHLERPGASRAEISGTA